MNWNINPLAFIEVLVVIDLVGGGSSWSAVPIALGATARMQPTRRKQVTTSPHHGG
jgi:hypothetical protein